MTPLLNAAITDTTGIAQRVASGQVAVFSYGTFDGDEVMLQAAPNVDGVAGTYVDLLTTPRTTPGVDTIYLPGVYWLRAVLTEASTNPISVVLN